MPKSVGRWLLIYTAHYSVTLKVVFIKESVAQLTGKLMLEDIAYQQSAEHGAAAPSSPRMYPRGLT